MSNYNQQQSFAKHQSPSTNGVNVSSPSTKLQMSSNTRTPQSVQSKKNFLVGSDKDAEKGSITSNQFIPQSKQNPEWVPEATFNASNYQQKGQDASLSSIAKKHAVDYIESNFDITGFPMSHGPISGSDYSSHLIQTYLHGTLERKHTVYGTSSCCDVMISQNNLDCLIDKGFEAGKCVLVLIATANDTAAALELLYEN